MSDTVSDLIQVGASAETRTTLEELKNHEHIADLMDGYRLGIAVAIAFGREPRLKASDRVTMFATGNLDPDMSIKIAIREIYPDARELPYRAAEDLAEQGVAILRDSIDGEDIQFDDLIKRIEKVNVGNG